jgi:hypothetical protein
MLTKERGISVVSGLVFFLAGLYLFALMASDISLRSFFVVISFAVVSLFLSATISHNLAHDFGLSRKNKCTQNRKFAFKGTVGS